MSVPLACPFLRASLHRVDLVDAGGVGDHARVVGRVPVGLDDGAAGGVAVVLVVRVVAAALLAVAHVVVDAGPVGNVMSEVCLLAKFTVKKLPKKREKYKISPFFGKKIKISCLFPFFLAVPSSMSLTP